MRSFLRKTFFVLVLVAPFPVSAQTALDPAAAAQDFNGATDQIFDRAAGAASETVGEVEQGIKNEAHRDVSRIEQDFERPPTPTPLPPVAPSDDSLADIEQDVDKLQNMANQ